MLFTHEYWKNHSFITIESKSYYTDEFTECFKSHGFQQMKYRMDSIVVNSYFHRCNCNRFKPVWYRSRKTRKGKYRFKHSADWKKLDAELRRWAKLEYGEGYRRK